MKKTLVIVLYLILLAVSGSVITTTANTGIRGLEEHLNALFFTNRFSQAQVDEMMTQWEMQRREGFAAMEPQAQLYLLKSYMVNRTLEEAFEVFLESQRPDFDNGIYVTEINTSRYANQYSQNKSFVYLLANSSYWFVPNNKSAGGERYSDVGEKLEKTISTNIPLSIEAYTFLHNAREIEKQLLSKGETVVSDIKLFSGLLVGLYIRCEDKEYIIKLYDFAARSATIPEIELYKLYEAKEFTGAFEYTLGPDVDEYRGGKILAQNVVTIKPTFTAEAEALQADGIISGNEKGLDPLKPLTRIEAATVLVRALGLENESAAVQSEFTDIPNDHWGVKYANIAADKGISKGVGDNKFAPDELVTDNQFATMLLRNSEQADFDWQQAINILIERSIITAENAGTMDLFTRGDMAKIIYEARKKGLLAER